MTYRGASALLMAGLAVAAVVSAPVADARPTCRGTGTTTCETNGSVSIKTRPATTAPPGNQTMVPWRERRNQAGVGAHGPAG